MRLPVSLSASLPLLRFALCASGRGVPRLRPASPLQPDHVPCRTTAPPELHSTSPSIRWPASSYDNRYDVSVGMAYDHIKAGPNLLQGSNLGGLDLSAAPTGSAATGPSRAPAAAISAPAAPPPTPSASTDPSSPSTSLRPAPSGSAPTTSTARSSPTCWSAAPTASLNRTCAAFALGGRLLQQPGRSGRDHGRPLRPQPLAAAGSSASPPMPSSPTTASTTDPRPSRSTSTSASPSASNTSSRRSAERNPDRTTRHAADPSSRRSLIRCRSLQDLRTRLLRERHLGLTNRLTT